MEIDQSFMFILITFIICLIDSILIPLVKWCFSIIKNKIAEHQKTKEQDGELADVLMKGIDKMQATLENKFNTIILEKLEELNKDKLYTVSYEFVTDKTPKVSAEVTEQPAEQKIEPVVKEENTEKKEVTNHVQY